MIDSGTSMSLSFCFLMSLLFVFHMKVDVAFLYIFSFSYSLHWFLLLQILMVAWQKVDKFNPEFSLMGINSKSWIETKVSLDPSPGLQSGAVRSGLVRPRAAYSRKPQGLRAYGCYKCLFKVDLGLGPPWGLQFTARYCFGPNIVTLYYSTVCLHWEWDFPADALLQPFAYQKSNDSTKFCQSQNLFKKTLADTSILEA